MSEQQKQVKAALKQAVERIRELKELRRKNEQWSKERPGWVNGPFGLELEQYKALATILCAARALAHGRTHSIKLPRFFPTVPYAGQTVNRWGWSAKTPEEFAAGVALEVAGRFPESAAQQAA